MPHASPPNERTLYGYRGRHAHDFIFVQGFISSDMCEAHLPKASEDTIAFMCGPPAMIKFACIPNLAKIGYTEDDYFSF